MPVRQFFQSRLLVVMKHIGFGLLFIWLFLYLSVWIFSPNIARWQINKQLIDYELKLSQSSSIRLNPFFFSVSLHNIQLTDIHSQTKFASVRSGEMDVDIWALFFKKVDFQVFEVDGVNINVIGDQSKWVVAGFNIPQKNNDSPDNLTKPKADFSNSWLVSAPMVKFQDMQLSLNHFEYSHDFMINHLMFKQVNVSENNQNFSLDFDGIFNSAPIQMAVTLENFSDQGELDVNFNMVDLNLDKIAYLIEEHLSGLVSFSSKQSIRFKRELAEINVSQASLQVNQLSLENNGLNAKVRKIQGLLNNARVNINAQGISEINADYSLLFGDTQVTTGESQDVLLSYSQLELKEGALNKNKETPIEIMFDQAIVKNILASKKQSLADEKESNQKAVANIEELTFSEFQFSQQHVELKSISAKKLNGFIKLDENKQWANLVLPTASKEVSAIKSDESSHLNREQPIYTFSIGEVKVSDESQLIFEDKSIEPAFLQHIQLNKMEFNSVDSRDTQKKAQFNIEFKTDEYANSNISGFIQPFKNKMNLQLESNIREFSLPKVSPYIRDAMGFEMLSGQFDTDIHIEIVDNKIDGKSHLAIRGLKLSSADNAEANSLKDQTAIPLNMALNMLKDGKGNVQLNVPLSGNLDDPDFGITGFVGLIVKKAIMSTAESYLIETFVPYANVLSVVRVAGEYLLKVRFEDLPYPNSVVDVQPQQVEFMREFSALLVDKSSTQVKICAIATAADLPDVEANFEDKKYLERLKKISGQRAQKFKAWVVEQGGVESSRLLLCQPQVDSSAEARPRIEFEV